MAVNRRFTDGDVATFTWHRRKCLSVYSLNLARWTAWCVNICRVERMHIRSMWNLSYNIKFNYAGLRRLYRCQFFSKWQASASFASVEARFFFSSLFFFFALLIVIFQAGCWRVRIFWRIGSISLLPQTNLLCSNVMNSKKKNRRVGSILCRQFLLESDFPPGSTRKAAAKLC